MVKYFVTNPLTPRNLHAISRNRLRGGHRPNGIRRIFPADPADAQVRQLANFRQHLIKHRTKVINKTKGIIDKHNLAQDAPMQDCTTKKFRQWITTVQLPVVDRLEVDMNIQSWELYDKQILDIEAELVKRSEVKAADVFRLTAISGISAMGAITLLSRIGDIKRFKNPDSLANYFGLTPGCHNSAGKHRVGGITKRGNAVARQVLNFAVNHVIRKDKASYGTDTPLHWAVHKNGDIAVIKYLIDEGADVNAKGIGGNTPLHTAAKWNPHVEVLKYLIERGANVHARSEKVKRILHEAMGLE